MNARRRCAKRVFTGERHDIGGHVCGNYAKEGSIFCHIHGPQAPEEDPSRDAERAPEVRSSQRRTYYVTLTWEPESGPVVKLPYRNGYGYITQVMAKAQDDYPMMVTCRGVVRRKDGSAGAQAWDGPSFDAEKLVPESWMAELKTRMAEERAR